MNTLNVIFRTCTHIGALNAHRFGSKRPFTDSKRELVFACLNSLLFSLGDKGIVHVLDDHSPEEDTGAIQALLRSYGDAHRFVPLEKKGAGHSFDSALQYAREQKFSLMYFCEDDYLHLPHAVSSMVDCHEQYKAIVFPVDYFERYVGRDKEDMYPSFIYLGEYNYWRTIYHTTFTFMIEKRVLDKYWGIYIELARANMNAVGAGGEDDTINKIYKKETCLSPLPSLAAHISPTPPLPPFVDWKTVFEKNKNEALRRIKDKKPFR